MQRIFGLVVSALVVSGLAMGCKGTAASGTTAGGKSTAGGDEYSPYTEEEGAFERWLIAKMATRDVKGNYVESDGSAVARFGFSDPDDPEIKCSIVVNSTSASDDGKEIMIMIRAWTKWFVQPPQWGAALPVLNQYHYDISFTKAFIDVKDYELTLQSNINMVGRPVHIDTMEDGIHRTVLACKYLVEKIKAAKVGTYNP